MNSLIDLTINDEARLTKRAVSRYFQDFGPTAPAPACHPKANDDGTIRLANINGELAVYQIISSNRIRLQKGT